MENEKNFLNALMWGWIGGISTLLLSYLIWYLINK